MKLIIKIEREEKKMTVKELMSALAQFDENMEVQIVDNHWCEAIEDVDEYDGVVLVQNLG
jgi:hypothetical protein